jgi:parallel beta-helix repeat protein
MEYDSSYNRIINNNISSNGVYGIYSRLGTISDNVIANNVINSNNDSGIFMSGAIRNNITNNIVSSNCHFGIWLFDNYACCSVTNYVINNTVNSNCNGIYIIAASDVIRNSACGNKQHDFYYMRGSSRGSNNTCSKSDGWNDIGTRGCTYKCNEVTTCDSCSDCTSKLSRGYKLVKLNNSISSSNTCITINSNNTIFDCQGHTINGSGSGA